MSWLHSTLHSTRGLADFEDLRVASLGMICRRYGVPYSACILFLSENIYKISNFKRIMYLIRNKFCCIFPLCFAVSKNPISLYIPISLLWCPLFSWVIIVRLYKWNEELLVKIRLSLFLTSYDGQVSQFQL